jgi:outer membrane protein W
MFRSFLKYWFDRAFTSRLGFLLASSCVLLAATPSPAAAQVDSVLTFNVGYFGLKGEDGRTENDVLVAELSGGELALAFDLGDFNGATFGGEWAVGLGNFFEAGVGANFYSRTVPSVYRELVDSDGSEIEQDLKLRVAPVTFVGRFFPIGRHNGFQPYIGGGLGIFAWRFSETGEFVDSVDASIFRATYEDSGNATGPIVFGGLRFSTGNVLVGGEFRYQDATTDLDPGVGFVSDRLDLGGYSGLFTIGLRF